MNDTQKVLIELESYARFIALDALDAGGVEYRIIEQGDAVAIDYPEFHSQGMGCGLEDRGITDRYEAMRYGFDTAVDKFAEILEGYGPLYTHPAPERLAGACAALAMRNWLSIFAQRKKVTDADRRRIERLCSDYDAANTAPAHPEPARAVPDVGSEIINEACWRFTEALTKDQKLPASIWNNMKPAMHAAISYALLATPQPPAPTPDIDAMLDRFLGWKLPKDFAPDCGISFQHAVAGIGKREDNEAWWPTGTNLFHAGQARAMIEYMLATPQAPEGE